MQSAVDRSACGINFSCTACLSVCLVSDKTSFYRVAHQYFIFEILDFVDYFIVLAAGVDLVLKKTSFARYIQYFANSWLGIYHKSLNP